VNRMKTGKANDGFGWCALYAFGYSDSHTVT